MPGKKKSNGYFMFMQAERKRIQTERKETVSIQEMAAICSETWKNLSEEQRSRYHAMAKGNNGGAGTQDRDRHRLDNQGQIIAERKNLVREVTNRKIRERQLMASSWEGPGILDVEFHMIDFQVMFTEEPVQFYLPLEVGVVCFTLRDGITKYMHRFINPGEPPPGNMHLALKHSDSTHKIPLHFQNADDDFQGLWTELTSFLMKSPTQKVVPPIFCLANVRHIVESCLEFIYYQARPDQEFNLDKVYTLEDLVLQLLVHSGKCTLQPSETQIQDSLLRNQWDYVSLIRCSYHDEVDSSYCSLAIVRRMSFAIFDMLSSLLDFKLTDCHMPSETTNRTFVVKPPAAVSRANTGRDTRFKVMDSQTDRNWSRHRPVSPQRTCQTIGLTTGQTGPSAARQGYQVDSAQVSDNADGCDDEDDYDDDETEEIKSTSNQYQLEELRKPRLPAMSLSGGFPISSFAFGRGLAMSGATAGTALNQPTPTSLVALNQPTPTSHVALNQPTPTSHVRPPPGFGPRPGVPATITSNLVPAMNTWSSVVGDGVIRGRGRGQPPQTRLY